MKPRRRRFVGCAPGSAPGVGTNQVAESRNGVRSFESKSDVLRLHVRHAHVPGGKSAVDRCDVILSEAKQREELDRRASVCHRYSNMIRIEYHLIAPCHQRRALGNAWLASASHRFKRGWFQQSRLQLEFQVCSEDGRIAAQQRIIANGQSDIPTKSHLTNLRLLIRMPAAIGSPQTNPRSLGCP